jgi:hypothetical protein
LHLINDDDTVFRWGPSLFRPFDLLSETTKTFRDLASCFRDLTLLFRDLASCFRGFVFSPKRSTEQNNDGLNGTPYDEMGAAYDDQLNAQYSMSFLRK